MPESDQHSPGFLNVARSLFRTGLGAVQNRVELFALEWEEERARLMQTVVWVAALVLLGILAVLLSTATIIFLFPRELRLYVTAGFAVIYVIGTIIAAFGVRHIVRRESFSESLRQMRKDREWLESLK